MWVSLNAHLYDDGIDTKEASWSSTMGLRLVPSLLLAPLGSALLIGQRLRSR